MRLNMKKSIAVAVTALTLAAGLAATSESAFAGPPGPIWHHGGYYGGHWRGGWWGGPALGLGIVGGLVAGAAIANSGPGYYGPGPGYYGPGPGYDPGCWQPRPTYDAAGRYVGTRPVDVCQ
jgi:hypothetical protein